MTIRQTIASNLIENTPESIRNLRHMIKSDSWAYIIYDDEKDNVRIEKYLDGVMPERMMRAFEKMIQKDDRLKRKFAERKRIHDNIHKLVPLIDNLEKAHQDFEEKYRNKDFTLKPVLKKEYVKNITIRWTAAAAILIFALGTLLITIKDPNPVNDELFANYYEPLKLKKGSNDFLINSSTFIEAKEKYYEKDYKAAYSLFKNLPDIIDIQYEKNFFMGLLLIEMGEYRNAIQCFEIADKDNFEFIPQVYWYLGLCYVKTGQYEKAIESLEYLVSGSNYKNSEAKKILRALK